MKYLPVMPIEPEPRETPNPKIGAHTGDDPYLPTSGNGGYTVTGYDLDLDYRANTERLEGTAVLTAVATQKLSRFSLDLVGLVASKISVNGTRVAKFSQADGTISIRPASPLPEGKPFTVMVLYAGFPHPTKSPAMSAPDAPGQRGEVGWTTFADSVHVVGSPNGAPTWFPCNDLASAKAPVRIRITCDTRFGVVATGELKSRQVRGERRTWVFATTEPVAPHQVGLALGQFSAVHSDDFAQSYASPALVAAGFESLEVLPRMRMLFEDAFGPFPLAAHAVLITSDELPMPLSAHGLTVIAATQLFTEESLSPGAFAAANTFQVDVVGGELLLAREFARQWFGASLTAQSWRHAWLHEGFALYGSWLWGDTAKLARRNWRTLSALPQDFTLADPGADRLFDARVAIRGALTLHALRVTVGDVEFFGLLRRWTQQHRHGTVTSEQFVDAATSTSPPHNSALRSLLHSWIEQAPLPPLPDPTD
jgi:aminopeptidase N